MSALYPSHILGDGMLKIWKFLIYIVIWAFTTIAVVAINNTSVYKTTIGQLDRDNYANVFIDIYKTNFWHKGSGYGSVPSNARQYIALLQKYFNDKKFGVIVDLGCGDWQIMSQITIPENKIYQCYEVVPHLVDENNKLNARSNIQFYPIKNLAEFKMKAISGDLLVVKDVLQHWPNEDIFYFIKNILPNFKYALITNEYELDSILLNRDISLGQFRSLNLQESPYNLQNVVEVLNYHGPGRKQVLFYTRNT